jgi:hypothetical protein
VAVSTPQAAVSLPSQLLIQPTLVSCHTQSMRNRWPKECMILLVNRVPKPDGCRNNLGGHRQAWHEKAK